MKTFYLFITIFLFLSCGKDNYAEVLNSFGYVQISSIEENPPKNNSRYSLETFAYKDNGLVLNSVKMRALPSENNVKTYYFNDQDRLQYIAEFDSLFSYILVKQDLFMYNSNGLISEIHEFSVDSAGIQILDRIELFKYNSENKITEVYERSLSTNEEFLTKRYTWEGGNILKVEKYLSTETLFFESSFEYDDKINYKINHPAFIKDPLNQTLNNPISKFSISHINLTTAFCTPCLYTYNYKDDDLPTLIKSGFLDNLFMTYEY